MLAPSEAAYKDPGEQAPMVFMASVGWGCDGNAYHWWEQKHPSFPNQTCSYNTNWETGAVHISGVEESVIKATVSVNSPLD